MKVFALSQEIVTLLPISLKCCKFDPWKWCVFYIGLHHQQLKNAFTNLVLNGTSMAKAVHINGHCSLYKDSNGQLFIASGLRTLV